MVAQDFNPDTSIPELNGKIFVITGGTNGLGAGCVKYLAAHNPSHIFFAGRNEAKANQVISVVKETSPNAAVTYIESDMANLTSIRSMAEQILTKTQRIDVLLCNAGIMCVDAATSQDGYEIQFQVNHLGHALLIKLLLPLLEKTADEPNADVRIVSMSSVAYNRCPRRGIEFDTLNTPQFGLGNPVFPGNKWSRYGQSKLANLLYAQELAKRYPKITTVPIHPGIIHTDLFTTLPLKTSLPAYVLTYGQEIPIEKGPYNQLWAMTCPREEIDSGTYYVPIGDAEPLKTSHSKDVKLREELWEWTQKTLEMY